MKFRVTLAYDGTAFHGFQTQANARSVQGELETALAVIAGHEVGVAGAGRTDTGVHATGQVAAFQLEWRHPAQDLVRALNSRLPEDLAVLDAAACDDRFHPRFSAISRTYEYAIVAAAPYPMLGRYAWRMEALPDREAMQAAADRLVGEADFAAFGTAPTGAASGETTVRRVLRAGWAAESVPFGREVWPGLRFTIEANAFLYRMVRRIVRALVRVGRGEWTPGDVETILKSGDPQRATGLAPAAGLCLVEVKY